MAEQRPRRIALGAVVATTATLRGIEVDGRPGEQVVFVYDDPSDANPLHAVVRGSLSLDRPEQTFVRDRVREAFCIVVQVTGH